MTNLKNAIVELYRKTSTELCPDVLAAMKKALKKEAKNSSGYKNLRAIIYNAGLAKRKKAPMCQDTGSITFYMQIPRQHSKQDFGKIYHAVHEATKEATKLGYLRPNAVDPITGKNTGDNISFESPQIVFDGSAGNDSKWVIDLLLKGGGCENVSRQYSLPCRKLNAERSIKGIKKAVVDAVVDAQGNGCPPGILGVCIGGTRELAYKYAKKQLLRRLDDKNPDRALAKLESDLLRDLNKLGIGPSGLGGKTTVLGVKVCKLSRVPASFFVTISYDCWALRRGRVVWG